MIDFGLEVAGKEGETMNSYVIAIEVNDGKLKELMDRIDAAQREIFNCYCELQRLGVLKITPAVEQPGQEGAQGDRDEKEAIQA